MDDIDFSAVAKNLQQENEQLRLTILKLRNERSPLEGIDFGGIAEWIVENYILIASIGMIVFMSLNIITLVQGLFTRNKE